MAAADPVLSASPLTYPPRKLLSYRHSRRKFPHYFHTLWNNRKSSLPIRLGTVDRSSPDEEGTLEK
jgi:hypothetical protein